MGPVAGTYPEYTSDGVVLSIKEAANAPLIRSDKYIFYGKVEYEMKAAPGAGIITGATLQSDDLDEIDIEWVGSKPGQVQSNYFHLGAGKDEAFDRGGTHEVGDATGKFHTYTINWTPSAMTWSVDGKEVRTVPVGNSKGKFPTSPMQVRIGPWVAGKPGTPPGTKDWAGGDTDFSKGPFKAIIRKLTVTDYAGGSTPATKEVKEYTYGDRSGSSDSIQIHPDGSSNKDSKGPSPSSDSSASSTSKETPKETSKETPKETSKTSSTSSAAKSTQDAPKTMSTSVAAQTSGTSDGGSDTGNAGSNTSAAKSTPTPTAKTDKSGASAKYASSALMGVCMIAWLAL